MSVPNQQLIKGVASGNVPAAAKEAIPTNTSAPTDGTTALTDSTGGTANTTLTALTAVGGSGATTTQEGEIEDNFADLAAQQILQKTANTNIIAQLAVQTTFNTAVVDAFQKLGVTIQS